VQLQIQHSLQQVGVGFGGRKGITGCGMIIRVAVSLLLRPALTSGYETNSWLVDNRRSTGMDTRALPSQNWSIFHEQQAAQR